MEPKMVDGKMIFLFNWVIFKFQPLILRGVYQVASVLGANHPFDK